MGAASPLVYTLILLCLPGFVFLPEERCRTSVGVVPHRCISTLCSLLAQRRSRCNVTHCTCLCGLPEGKGRVGHLPVNASYVKCPATGCLVACCRCCLSDV